MRSSKGVAIQDFSNILKKTRKAFTGKPNKAPKQLERHLKGVANHWRISILLLVGKREGITLDQISQELDCNIKTTSEHTRRLVQAGLLQKKYVGNNVAHSLTPYGKTVQGFLISF